MSTGSILMQQAGQYAMPLALGGLVLLGIGIYRSYSHGMFNFSTFNKVLLAIGVLLLILAGVSQAYTKSQVSKAIAQ